MCACNTIYIEKVTETAIFSDIGSTGRVLWLDVTGHCFFKVMTATIIYVRNLQNLTPS